MSQFYLSNAGGKMHGLIGRRASTEGLPGNLDVDENRNRESSV